VGDSGQGTDDVKDSAMEGLLGGRSNANRYTTCTKQVARRTDRAFDTDRGGCDWGKSGPEDNDSLQRVGKKWEERRYFLLRMIGANLSSKDHSAVLDRCLNKRERCEGGGELGETTERKRKKAGGEKVWEQQKCNKHQGRAQSKKSIQKKMGQIESWRDSGKAVRTVQRQKRLTSRAGNTGNYIKE